MRNIVLVLILLLVASGVYAQTYHIDWYVIGSGGGHSQSGSYQLDGTIGQPIVGKSSSANYQIEAGFWVGAASLGPVCDYVTGDANGSSSFTGLDVTYSVRYFKGGTPPPYSCECTAGHTWYVSGDVNGSCSFSGLDVTMMVRHFKTNAAVSPCPDCPPGGLLVPLGPGEIPTPTVQPNLAPAIKTDAMKGNAE
jgi:hypothetical protein